MLSVDIKYSNPVTT